MKKKIVSLVLVFALALALGIGGTVAWLTAQTDSVVNTFTVGDINIKLAETPGTEYKMVPGNTITKDPKVTVLANSEACFLFVKIEKSTTPKYDDFMEQYVVAQGWNELPNVSGIYYREVAASTAAQDFNVLEGNQVKVKDTVTKAAVNALGTPTGEVDAHGNAIYTYDSANLPKLTFTAYAVQKVGSADATAAWAKLNP